jgi:hypothetical protein
VFATRLAGPCESAWRSRGLGSTIAGGRPCKPDWRVSPLAGVLAQGWVGPEGDGLPYMPHLRFVTHSVRSSVLHGHSSHRAVSWKPAFVSNVVSSSSGQAMVVLR